MGCKNLNVRKFFFFIALVVFRSLSGNLLLGTFLASSETFWMKRDVQSLFQLVCCHLVRMRSVLVLAPELTKITAFESLKPSLFIHLFIGVYFSLSFGRYVFDLCLAPSKVLDRWTKMNCILTANGWALSLPCTLQCAETHHRIAELFTRRLLNRLTHSFAGLTNSIVIKNANNLKWNLFKIQF